MWLGANGATASVNSPTLAVTAPGGLAPPNNAIIIIHGSCGFSSTDTFSSPGFAAIPGLSNIGYIGAAGTGFVMYKVAGASEPTNYTVTSSANDLMALQINTFSGRNISSPFSAVSSSPAQFNGSPFSITCGSVLALNGDDQLFLDCIGNNVSNTSPTLTAPSGFSNVLNTFSSVTNCPSVNSCSRSNIAGGNTGSITGSVAFTSGANNDAGGYLISLAAALALPPTGYSIESVEYF
jgi:hypothetical protein